MKNILFDLDGTLTDPQEGIINCIQYALDRLSVQSPPRETMKKYIGPSLWDSFMELLSTENRDEAFEAVKIYRERFSSEGMFENRVYDGIHTALNELTSSGYELYICTSKPEVFAEQIAEHFGLADFFTKIYGSRLDGTLVEKTDLIAHILACESLLPEETAMIGDRKYDIKGALNNRLSPFGVSYGFGSPEELKDAIQIFATPALISHHFCS